MIGKRLANRYEIQRRIGEGGMAIVYRAHDTVLDRPVAAKILRPELAGDQEFVRRFRREARAAASLSHPNIVAIYDVGRHQGWEYIIMEYVEGQTLKEKIRREAPLPVPRAVALTRQILRALDHAHRHGIVHRDIKPQNILVTRHGRVKVTDLGIARATGASTLVDRGAVLGTAHYIAPEQAAGKHTGVQSDLYSLGVVLYEMLTGRLPFDGESPVEIALKHVQEPPPPPRAFNPEIPPVLEAIVLKALEKDPAHRYRSAAEFLDDLLRYRSLRPERVRRLLPDEAGATIPLAPVAVAVPLPAPRPAAPPAPALPVPDDPPPADPPPAAADSRPRPAARRRIPPWLAWPLLLAGLFLLAGGVVYGVSTWLSPPLVPVPSLVGKSLAEARQALEPLGVRVEVVRQVSSPRPPGTVVSQDPQPGERVRRGGSVQVVVSRGARRVAVPHVETMDAREARLTLERQGFRVEEVPVADPAARPGSVVRQEPAAGTELEEGSTVRIFVATEVPQEVVLPDFTGRPLPEVQAELRRLGLTLASIMWQATDYPAQQVIGQRPRPGDRARRGDAVVLTVSQGNGLQPNVSTLRITLEPEPAVQDVWIRVEDERGQRVVRHDTYRGGQQIVVNVYWYGSEALVRIVINGQEAEPVRLRRE